MFKCSPEDEARAQAFGAFLLRITLGAFALSHGLQKVLLMTVPAVVDNFAAMGYPSIVAYLTIFAEIAGGLALLFGVFTRLAALLMIPLLVGVTYTHIFIIGSGWEFPAFWTMALAAQVFLGSGKYALGRLMCKRSS